MSFLYFLEDLRTPFLDKALGLISECGGEIVYMLVAIVVFWCVSKNLGYYILTTGFLGTIVNQFLKLFFRVPRPWVIDESFTIVESARAGATGYSFPSGHTQNVFASFGGLARWTKNRVFRAVCIAVVVLVAFSRMYLGVHQPKDVLVSAIIGTILVFALYPLFRDIDKHPRRMYAILGGMIATTIIYLLYAELWNFPADIDVTNLAEGRKNGYSLLGASTGMLVAYFIDMRYVHFETRAPLPAQVVKVVLGLAIVVALKVFLKAPLLALLGHSGTADAARYFIIIIFAAGVWPMTFRRFFSRGERKD